MAEGTKTSGYLCPSRSRQECGFLAESEAVRDTMGVASWSANQFKGDEAVIRKRWTEFEPQILKKLTVVHSEDDLPAVFLSEVRRSAAKCAMWTSSMD